MRAQLIVGLTQGLGEGSQPPNLQGNFREIKKQAKNKQPKPLPDKGLSRVKGKWSTDLKSALHALVALVLNRIKCAQSFIERALQD